MTTIDGLPSAEHIARAKALRRASVAIATHAEPGPTRADVLEKLALLIADLEGMPARECRSCGIPFGVGRDELAFYRSRGLSTPDIAAAAPVETGAEQQERDRTASGTAGTTVDGRTGLTLTPDEVRSRPYGRGNGLDGRPDDDGCDERHGRRDSEHGTRQMSGKTARKSTGSSLPSSRPEEANTDD